ncbi:sigma-54 interaction domain-containing protein [Marinomonas pollencensis]|uniref:Fis family sigma54 specific transcriptional regulator n=1 Tax=Marinomonas pollencensis TaxID=491954 RepID=A0A3E0DSY1_9GAMM|nr:sigma-54 dependent transcriptional regulator [Marinomonas pollencensis]REG86657.1 Fis family sigma54 specific transcriptional regulator [Marinomonas pollencensis]
MPSPKLFIHTRDPSLASALLSLESVRQFELMVSNQTECWLEQLTNAQCQVALIEVDNMEQASFAALQDSELLNRVEFSFFSQGKPDPLLDQVMQKGAGFHYRAPVNYSLVDASLRESFIELSDNTRPASSNTSHLDQFGQLVGSSVAMHSLYRTIRKVAATTTNAFIIGESGSGKELVANTLHIFSERSAAPFVAINCGALSPELIDSELFGHVKGAFTGAYKDHEGVFEQAQGGTLFLDEITEMPYEHQVKLLRVLESGEYKPVGGQNVKTANVRIIAATNRDLGEAIKEETFREDLYFRLAQFPISVPPLREREDDARGLAQHFLAYRNAQDKTQKSLSASTLDKIQAYSWPGNVRELKHTIERACILANDVIEPEHLIINSLGDTEQADDGHGIPVGMRLDDIEKIAITETLKENDGNKTDTAQQLGISVKTLYNKLDKYDSSN